LAVGGAGGFACQPIHSRLLRHYLVGAAVKGCGALALVSRYVTDVLSEHEGRGRHASRTLEDHLAEAPESHPVIPGTGGIRKARWGRGTKGKSGGVRAIYYYLVARTTIYLLALYSKSRKTGLTERERKEFKKLVQELKGETLQ
jgi:mRNA-degrading endonuclease RelE of RelBE toxin-antitoxin system